MTRSGPLLAALYTWLLPFAVAAAGFGVHYALHVPPGPLPPPSPQKIEDDKKAADKKKKEEDKKKRDEERKAGKKPKVDRGPRELPYEPFARPREQYLLDQLWAYYEPEDFKKEPTFDAWQTAHKPLISHIVQSARTVGFATAPVINVIGTECHTIRCRFTLTGSEDDLTGIITVLRDLELGGASLWHKFEAADPSPDKKDTGGRFKSQLTVSFIRDLPALTAITVPGKGPLSVPRPTPSAPAPAPTTPPPTAPASTTTSTGPIPGAAPTGYVDPSGAPLRTPTPG
jgi:hypothetical protein